MAANLILFVLPLILLAVFLRMRQSSPVIACIFPIVLVWSYATWAVAGPGEVGRLGQVDYAWITIFALISIAAILLTRSHPSKVTIALASSWSLMLIFYSGDKVWAFPGPEGGLGEFLMVFVGGIWLLAAVMALFSTKSMSILVAVLWFSAVTYYPILQWPPEALRQIVGSKIVGSSDYYYTKITKDYVYAIEKLADPEQYPYRVVVFVNNRDNPAVFHRRVVGYYTGYYSKVNPQFVSIPGPILCVYLPSPLHCDTQLYLFSAWPRKN